MGSRESEGEVSITIGWWGIPLVLSILAFVVAAICVARIPKGSGDYNFGPLLEIMVYGGGALIFSLVVWLIYFAIAYFTK
jgi:hypothetical protein